MVRQEVPSDWMERSLEQGLTRVRAPEELWDRVRSPRIERPGVHIRMNAARMSACATFAVAIIVLLWGVHPRIAGGALQLRSSNPAEIRAWVFAKTGLDVPLHSGQLIGASVKQGRVEVAYSAGAHNIFLVVSKNRDKNARYSWTADGQSYMLACAEPRELAACLLCHVGG